ncbi:3D domain-containing protein [Candidatus Clostridium radicumherbarum]|uniref:3D domain-containing protein n=1 Tax=Candidatus Clostridium radicumherbarum TaxID=3381662 RepID=A0ABW8TMG2_9CLOT
MDKLKAAFKSCFTNGPKAIFIVMLLLMSVTIGIDANRKTIIVTIDGKETKITTFRSTFEDALKVNNIVLGSKDKTTPSINNKLQKNDRIDIKRAVNVTVEVDGEELNIKTTEATADKMFNSEGIKIFEEDKVIPSKDAVVKEGLKLIVTRVETKILEEKQILDFATVVKKDENAKKGSTKVLQDGQEGEKVITTKLVYENGKEVKRDVIDETITKNPVQKIVAVGTLSTVSLSRGEDVMYKTSFRARTTAYSAGFSSTGKRPGDKNYGKTASGTIAKRDPQGYSSVAVDPRVIPLGTKLFIEGYGYAVAEDTGGAIKGNAIDVFFETDSECFNWGVKNVNVYILK